MSKMSTDLTRHALNGPTMGTRWSAQFHTAPDVDPNVIQIALQAAVAEVDTQMSTWSADSDLMRVNAAPVGEWCDVPAMLMTVIALGLDIGRTSNGAFDIGMGDAVTAWGFGPAEAAPDRIKAAMNTNRVSASDALDLDVAAGRLRKTAPIAFDLNGIAKGYGVDRLAETLRGFGIMNALVGIDGEMRTMGLRPDGAPWSIAVETPDPESRSAHSVLALQDAAVATSGDYRHWVEVQGRNLSHTMDPHRGAPLMSSPASVTVVAQTCAEADAWATVLMVLGAEQGAALARTLGLDALFLLRMSQTEYRSLGVGRLFAEEGTVTQAPRRAE
ncbi:FAD:protein FMN transferase [Celeribacter baekdonensis]|uniref:FAD:protein FMN transferase n=1 Tax=Celeribacter baekdonensis TaxID=875171 RepID=A0A2R4M4G6_9RHOB|nr:FAD:protein FMN transferase [Celeribacter baekdonensis]AVW92100.1 thiamine biosynthesis protein ApbE [Celeribacter baekdonensis]